MGCESLSLQDGRAVLHCNTSGNVFGQPFASTEDADEFCFFVVSRTGKDPRALDPSLYDATVEEWRAWSPHAGGRRILERISSEAWESDDPSVRASFVVQLLEDEQIIDDLVAKGLVEVDRDPPARVSLTDLGAKFVREFL